MNKIPCTTQNTEAKTLPADVCAFGCFGLLSPAAVHSADCQFDSEVKWWIHVSSIVTYLCKNPFLLCWNSCKQCSELSIRCCFWSTLSKCSTQFEHSFHNEKCSCRMVNTLPSDVFNSSANSHSFNLWSDKMSLWSFFGVFQDNYRIWVTWAFSIICVCTTMFKVSIPPLNHYIRWSRVWIILIKLLLCLNRIFTHQKAMLYQHRKFRFFISFENLQQ